jgi:hypothetical protein
MSWVCNNPARYAGQVVASGHCVRLVQEATAAPHTSRWRRGAKVRNGAVPAGTAIATFGADGYYENRTDGASHAAILIAEKDNGLRVWDQWKGHPVAERTIRWRGGQGKPVNDGDAYYVI